MKYLIYLAALIAITSCSTEDSFNIPKGGGVGDYDYTSTTIYYDQNNNEINTGGNYGVVNYFSTSDFTVTPLLGWEYSLRFSNLQVYTLSTGQQVTTFSIGIQDESIYGNNETSSFRIKGTKSIELRDPNGIYYGSFDGLIDVDGTILCEFESFNVDTYKKVKTKIEATSSN
jgi:hypothetical protein